MPQKKTFLEERFNILFQARHDFVFVSVAGFGGSLITYLFSEKTIPRWIIGVTIFGWLLILLALILFRAQRELASTAKEEKIIQAEELRNQLIKERRDDSINLTDRVISVSSGSLRSTTEEIKQNSKAGQGVLSEIKNHNDYLIIKERMLRIICRDIQSVFDGDSRGIDTTTYPYNYFKIALFEPEPSPIDAKILKRTYYAYPEGIEPSKKTHVINIKDNQRAAAVLSFLEENIVMIEDIQTECKKPADERRWAELRENQSKEYESMICVPIVSGTKGQPDRKCLGVLVIDTNRKRYFIETRPFQGFIGNLLNPFRTILSFVLDLQTYCINR